MHHSHAPQPLHATPLQIVFTPQQDPKHKGPPIPGAFADASQQSLPEEPQEPEVALKPYQFLMVNVLRCVRCNTRCVCLMYCLHTQ